MSDKIVMDKKYLSRVCKTVATVEEGERIAAELFKELSKNQHGIGLSANQIGIQKRVCAINVSEPIYLINPEIIKTEGDTTFVEGCLSFPNQSVRTKRAQHITVTADNYDEPITFGPNSDDKELQQLELLESVCVQHEIDHLNGITMFDKEFKQEPIKRGVNAPLKIGRNEKVVITNGKETKMLKFKKAESLINNGDWKLTEV